jgi:hypothetical protein
MLRAFVRKAKGKAQMSFVIPDHGPRAMAEATT